MNRLDRLLGIASMLFITGCSTTITVDEYRQTSAPLEISGEEKVIILGRRDAGHYETGMDFVECVGSSLRASNIQVIPEDAFIDALYPWFEPRSAPRGIKRLRHLVGDPMIANTIQQLDANYMIWLDGQTQTVDSAGSMSCAIGPGGGGCFGFATWDKVSNYEAIVWSLKDLTEIGRVSVDAEGSSYLIGVGAPIPFIARVQGEACNKIGDQLTTFFNNPGE